MGNDVFRHFILFLDYKNQRVILEKGADFEKSFPEGKAGMIFILNDSDEIEILNVTEGAAAHKAGIKKGDLLISVDGKNINNFLNFQDLINLFKAPEGTVYRLKIKRDDKFIEKKTK